MDYILDNIYVDLYISHALVILEQEFVHCWWKFQAEIIIKLRRFRGLQTVVIIVPSLFQVNTVSKEFQSLLIKDDWALSTRLLDFPLFGDSIDDSTTVVLGVHRTAQSSTAELAIASSPKQRCRPISDFIHDEFNKSNYAVSFSKADIPRFSSPNGLIAAEPQPTNSPCSLDRSK